MRQFLFISTLLLSTALSAHNPFQPNPFASSFNDGFWHDFNRQFQQINHHINQIKSSNMGFMRHFFDKERNHYVAQIAIEGLQKNNLDISTHNNIITIKSYRETEQTTNEASAHSTQSFVQSFSLPADADKDNITATFDNNILSILIPKIIAEKSQEQKIEIK